MGINERKEIEHTGQKLDESLCRSKRMLRDYILCNPFEYFCTFTFDREKVNRGDYKECLRKLTKFLNNYRSRYAPNFRYCIVPEMHKDGSWHFHGVVSGIRLEDLFVPDTILKRYGDSLRRVPNTPGYVSWRNYEKSLGFFNLSKIKNQPACARYITKYITKDLQSVDLGRQVVLHSNNLQKPELVFDEDNVPCRFESQIESPFCLAAFLSEKETVGDLLPEYWDYPQSSYADEPIEDDALPFEPLKFSQLVFC